MTKNSAEGSFFRSQKYTDWPTVKEALIAKEKPLIVDVRDSSDV